MSRPEREDAGKNMGEWAMSFGAPYSGDQANLLWNLPALWMQTYVQSLQWATQYWSAFMPGFAPFQPFSSITSDIKDDGSDGWEAVSEEGQKLKSLRLDPYKSAMRTLSAEVETAVDLTHKTSRRIVDDLAEPAKLNKSGKPAGKPAANKQAEANDAVGQREAQPPREAAAAQTSPEQPAPIEAGAVTQTIDDHDDLTRIRGIGHKLAARLREKGVSSFSDLAHLSHDEQSTLDGQLNLRGRLAREHWCQQAAALHAQKQSNASHA